MEFGGRLNAYFGFEYEGIQKKEFFCADGYGREGKGEREREMKQKMIHRSR